MKYYNNYKYQLAEDISIQTDIRPALPIETIFIDLTLDGLLTVKEWYAWDGPSGPTIDTPSSITASLFHDALYQLIREGFLPMKERGKADKILHDVCCKNGMYHWRADLWEEAVQHFAKSAAEWENEHKVIEAP